MARQAGVCKRNHYCFCHGVCSGFEVRHATRMEKQGARSCHTGPPIAQPTETRQKDRTRNGEAGGVLHTHGVSERRSLRETVGDRRPGRTIGERLCCGGCLVCLSATPPEDGAASGLLLRSALAASSHDWGPTGRAPAVQPASLVKPTVKPELSVVQAWHGGQPVLPSFVFPRLTGVFVIVESVRLSARCDY
jgi:hypothetical protein